MQYQVKVVVFYGNNTKKNFETKMQFLKPYCSPLFIK